MSLTRHGAAGERVAVNLFGAKDDERRAPTVSLLPLPNVVSPHLQLTRVAIKAAFENSEAH